LNTSGEEGLAVTSVELLVNDAPWKRCSNTSDRVRLWC